MSDRKTENITSGIAANITSEDTKNLENISDVDTLKSRLNNLIDKAELHYQENYQKKFDYFENLYEGRREKTEGMAEWRSNLVIQLPFNAVQDEMPSTMDGLIGDGGYFSFEPRPGKEYMRLKGEAWADLVQYFYDKAGFFLKTYDAILSAKKYGIGFVKQTWKSEVRKKETYAEVENEKGEPTVGIKKDEELDAGLCLEVLDANRVFLDPEAETWEELNKYGYVCEYSWVTREVIKDMRDKVGANKSEIDAFMDMAENREAYERYKLFCVYTSKEAYWLTGSEDGTYLIRRLKNPYAHGNIPIYHTLKFKRDGQIIGAGVVEKIADMAEGANNWINLMLDNAVIAINKVVAVKKGSNIDPVLQSLEPGSAPQFDDPQRDVNVLNFGDINPSSFNILENFLGLAQRISGSSAGITTVEGANKVNNRTATGASIIAYTEAQQTSLEVKINRESYLKPILRDGIDLIKQYITQKQVNRILPPEKAALILVDEDRDTFWDDFNFVIKGESGFVGRQREMEKLNVVLQVIQSVEQVAAMVPNFNKEAYYKLFFSALGVPNEIIKSAPPETKVNVNDFTPQEMEKINMFVQQTGIPLETVMEGLNQGMTFAQIAQEAQNAMVKPGQTGI